MSALPYVSAIALGLFFRRAWPQAIAVGLGALAIVTSADWQKTASDSRYIPPYGSESWERIYGRP